MRLKEKDSNWLHSFCPLSDTVSVIQPWWLDGHEIRKGKMIN